MNKINVAVLGLGEMGTTHVEAAKESPFVEKIVGYEPVSERAVLRGKELRIETTSNLDNILQDESIKLVYIAAPNEVHMELAVRSLKAGKAVLCEKPMGITLDEAKAIMQAEKESGSFLQIGFEARYSMLYMKVKEWIDAGLIGKPLNSHCLYYCSEFHKKNTWRSKSKGSLIGEKLSHYLDLPRWWFGKKVTEVFAMSAPNFVNYFNHPDNHQIYYKFEDGTISNLNFVMGIAESDFGDPLRDILEKQSDDGHVLKYMIYGNKGAIETDVFRRRIRRWAFSDGPEKLESKIVEEIKYDKSQDLQWGHNVHGQNLRIAELVAKNMKPESPAADAFETMKLCFAAEKSADTGKPVLLNEIFDN